MKTLVSIVFAVTALTGALGGCRGQTSTQPQIVPIRNMHQQPRYNFQAESKFFEDGRTMRPPVAGTIAREMEIDLALSDGRNEDGSWVHAVPSSVAERMGGPVKMVERGQERYDIYCTPCHDGTGRGYGLVRRRSDNAAFAPTNLHEPRLREIPDGQLFATISNGIRQMPAYYAQIPVDDRWAIVSYVRALQLSQPRMQ